MRIPGQVAFEAGLSIEDYEELHARQPRDGEPQRAMCERCRGECRRDGGCECNAAHDGRRKENA
jgi:hypothetical protein